MQRQPTRRPQKRRGGSRGRLRSLDTETLCSWEFGTDEDGEYPDPRYCPTRAIGELIVNGNAYTRCGRHSREATLARALAADPRNVWKVYEIE